MIESWKLVAKLKILFSNQTIKQQNIIQNELQLQFIKSKH